MMTMAGRWSYPVLAGLALGNLLLAGCASSTTSDPPALTPTSASQSRPQLGPVPAVASGDEFESREAAVNRPERDGPVGPRSTMKKFKPSDGSTKTNAEGATDAGSASAAADAVPAVGAPAVPAAFAERRASEALDRLAGLVTIRHEKRGAVITLPSDRLVDSGEWALTTSGRYSLRELATGLRDQDGRMIRIQGYTDSMGTPANNDALSLRRAESVREFLIANGVAAASMRAEGMGAKRPLAHNGTADGRAQNRRIEIVIAPLE